MISVPAHVCTDTRGQQEPAHRWLLLISGMAATAQQNRAVNIHNRILSFAFCSTFLEGVFLDCRHILLFTHGSSCAETGSAATGSAASAQASSALSRHAVLQKIFLIADGDSWVIVCSDGLCGNVERGAGGGLDNDQIAALATQVCFCGLYYTKNRD